MRDSKSKISDRIVDIKERQAKNYEHLNQHKITRDELNQFNDSLQQEISNLMRDRDTLEEIQSSRW